MSLDSSARRMVDALTRPTPTPSRGVRGVVRSIRDATVTVQLDGEDQLTIVDKVDSGARGIRVGDICLVVPEGRELHVESYVLTKDRM